MICPPLIAVWERVPFRPEPSPLLNMLQNKLHHMESRNSNLPYSTLSSKYRKAMAPSIAAIPPAYSTIIHLASILDIPSAFYTFVLWFFSIFGYNPKGAHLHSTRMRTMPICTTKKTKMILYGYNFLFCNTMLKFH